MDALSAPHQQIRSPPHPEGLHLFGAERRSSNLQHPHRLARHCARLRHPLRPLVDLPVVPVQRKPMHAGYIDMLNNPEAHHHPQKVAIARRNSAKHDGQLRVHLAYRMRSQLHHVGEPLPARIKMKIPVRKIIRLVPKHDGFDHSNSLPLRNCRARSTRLYEVQRRTGVAFFASICRFIALNSKRSTHILPHGSESDLGLAPAWMQIPSRFATRPAHKLSYVVGLCASASYSRRRQPPSRSFLWTPPRSL